MKQNKILETQRLVLRELELTDTNFIIQLVNSPKWLKFIGDKNVRTEEEAKKYLENGPIKSYKENGFGLWLVQLKTSDTPIGMCGLIKRETLENVDIGFAMLPEYEKLGYGFEIANATMNYAKNVLRLNKIIGITDPANKSSIKLLNRIGLAFEKTKKLLDNDTVLVFSPFDNVKDKNEMDILTARFFDVFTNTNHKVPDINKIKELCVPEVMFINNTAGMPETCNVEQFIASREKMLRDGTLIDFSENEISHTIDIYGNIAQRFSLYQKSGKMNNVYFESKGMKSIQYLKINQQWKICSVTWSDEIQNK